MTGLKRLVGTALLKELLAKNVANAPILFLIKGTEDMACHPKITNFRHNNLPLAYNEMALHK